jgi:hypothetical protein
MIDMIASIFPTKSGKPTGATNSFLTTVYFTDDVI